MRRNAFRGPVGLGLFFSSVLAVTAPAGALSQPATAAAKPPEYAVVPLHGTIGLEIVAERVERALRLALKEPDTILVLDIDSPGGLVSECEAILDLLAGHRARRSIAFIRNAYSAAAIIALTCDEIYMTANASIGAATSVQLEVEAPEPVAPARRSSGRPGTQRTTRESPKVAAADEKIQSVWRATCRRAAEVGGHDPLFADAMVDREVQLRIVEANGKKTLQKALEITPEDLQARVVVTEKGKLLTATAREAVSFGLSRGIAVDLDGVGDALGFGEWKVATTSGEKVMTRFRREAERDVRRVEKHWKTASLEFRKALRYDPANSTYELNRSRKFTQASRDKWRKLSRRCHDSLGRCEAALRAIEKTIDDYPLLSPHAESIAESRRSIREARARVAQASARAGV